ncbi:MAG: sulfotransferase domain-containing protein [Bacteroidota bacterium]
MRPPDFVIAGHPKCGSTTLQKYLVQHPQLDMGPNKEPSLYLDHWQSWQQGELTYYTKTERNDILLGDATVGYVKQAVVAERIARCNPETKIVFLVRDPIARALSHYHHWLRHGKDVRSLRKVILHSSPDHYFYLFGSYFQHLTTYLSHFPNDQVFHLFFEDLVQDPSNTLIPLWDFLGIEKIETEGDRHWENAGHGVKARRLSRWLKVQKESGHLRRVFPAGIRRIGGEGLRRLEAWNRSSRRHVPAAEELEYMKAIFYPEVAGTINFLKTRKGRTGFPDWTKEYLDDRPKN